MIKHLICFEHHAAPKGVLPMIEPRRHYNHVLLGRIGSPEYVAKVVKIPGVTHRYHDIPRSYTQGFVRRFLVSVYAELVESLRPSCPTVNGEPFRVGEQGEEDRAEGQSADRSLVLREEIHH